MASALHSDSCLIDFVQAREQISGPDCIHIEATVSVLGALVDVVREQSGVSRVEHAVTTELVSRRCRECSVAGVREVCRHLRLADIPWHEEVAGKRPIKLAWPRVPSRYSQTAIAVVLCMEHLDLVIGAHRVRSERRVKRD